MLTIRGEGQLKQPPCTGRFKIDREARGTILLDRRLEGAAIAGSPDYSNKTRYESWIGTKDMPIQMRVHDVIVGRGPLFAPNQIRLDTLTLKCPADPKTGTWETGELGWPTFQIDWQTGTFLWDAPRIEAKTESTFVREFIEGPKSWTSKPALRQRELRLGYQIIYDLVQPREWFRIKGTIKKDQTEVVLSRTFPFRPSMMAGLKPPLLEARLTLVLRRSP